MKGRENSACSSLLSEGWVISSPNPDMTPYASKATVHTSHLDGMTKFVESSLKPETDLFNLLLIYPSYV